VREPSVRPLETLLDSLAVALGEMVDMTCPDMRPLWLELSLPVRHRLLEGAGERLPEVPERLKVPISKASRSKYKSLAGWRHTLVWQGWLLAPEPGRKTQTGTPDARGAVAAIYFTPYPLNRPPYAFSGQTSAIPGLDSTVSSVGRLRALARRGCWESIKWIRGRYRYLQSAELDDDLEFLELGLKRSLRDVLKLEKHWDKDDAWDPLAHEDGA